MACESWHALSPDVRPPSSGTPPEEEPDPDDEVDDPDDAEVPDDPDDAEVPDDPDDAEVPDDPDDADVPDDDPDEELEPEPEPELDDDDPEDVPPADDDPDPDDEDEAPDEEALPDEPELDVPPASATLQLPCPLSLHAVASEIARENRTPPRMFRPLASCVTGRERGFAAVLERAARSSGGSPLRPQGLFPSTWAIATIAPPRRYGRAGGAPSTASRSASSPRASRASPRYTMRPARSSTRVAGTRRSPIESAKRNSSSTSCV
jgi:hypothetical protein